eukprot:4878324-Heterocapsa_arctica.AAC.1
MSAEAVNRRLPSGIEMDEKASDAPISITGDLLKNALALRQSSTRRAKSGSGTSFEASAYESPLDERGDKGQ